MAVDNPPVGFSFCVSFLGDENIAFQCQEVSGFETEIETQEVVEGGENRFVHKLPKAAKYSNLQLKRGMTSANAPLVAWCKSTLENSFSEPIQPKDITISLLNEHGASVVNWQVSNSYPVKWSVGALDAMKNAIAIETIELAYSHITRKP